MNNKFDELTKGLAQSATRRSAVPLNKAIVINGVSIPAGVKISSLKK